MFLVVVAGTDPARPALCRNRMQSQSLEPAAPFAWMRASPPKLLRTLASTIGDGGEPRVAPPPRVVAAEGPWTSLQRGGGALVDLCLIRRELPRHSDEGSSANVAVLSKHSAALRDGSDIVGAFLRVGFGSEYLD